MSKRKRKNVARVLFLIVVAWLFLIFVLFLMSMILVFSMVWFAWVFWKLAGVVGESQALFLLSTIICLSVLCLSYITNGWRWRL